MAFVGLDLKMFNLPEDVLVSVFGNWTSARDLCRSCTANPKGLQKLFKHAGFIWRPKCYLKDECLAWISLKGIKVELLKEHRKDEGGNQYWQQNQKLHRDNDLPAVIMADGRREWCQNGYRHRDNDLPAVVKANGDQEWFRNGNRHRDNDLPAVVKANGDQEWYRNGLPHRDNDLPAVIDANGDREWWQNGDLHRDNDLPAVVNTDGQKGWWKNGREVFYWGKKN